MDESRRKPDDASVESLLEALNPDATTIERVVRGALAAPETVETPTPWRRRWLVAAAAGLVLALLGTLPWWRPAAPPHPRQATLTITNHDGPVAVLTPTGTQLVVLPGGTDAKR